MSVLNAVLKTISIIITTPVLIPTSIFIEILFGLYIVSVGALVWGIVGILRTFTNIHVVTTHNCLLFS